MSASPSARTRASTRAATKAPTKAAALCLAIALDARFGDPPNAVHPVAWLGNLARLVEARVSHDLSDPKQQRGQGLAATVALTAFAVATIECTAPPATLRRTMTTAALLACTTSQRTLLQRVGQVAQALQPEAPETDALDAADLPAARKLAARHLVSRDTAGLDAGEVAGAALESLAENLSDGVVAPWFWYAIGGAPAAWAYRALNTLDSMWGYRTPEYIDFGRAAARFDDDANLVPARLTALAIIAAAVPEGRTGPALRIWWRDRASTPFPNAGHPMAAMAGATGTALTNHDHKTLLYNLGAGFPHQPPPTSVAASASPAALPGSSPDSY